MNCGFPQNHIDIQPDQQESRYLSINVFYLVMGHVIVMGHFQFTLSQVQKYQYHKEYEINHAKTLLIGRQYAFEYILEIFFCH